MPGFLLGDLLVFLPALQLDILDGRIQFFDLGHVVQVGIFQLLEQGGGFRQLLRILIVVVQTDEDVEGSRSLLVGFVELRLAGLALQAGHLAFDFTDDVHDPIQILAGGFDFARGLDAALFEARHAGGFFDEVPALVRAGIGNSADVALLNDGKRFRAQSAAQEKVVDVFEPAGAFVEKIAAFARAIQAPCDHDFGIVAQFDRERCRCR